VTADAPRYPGSGCSHRLASALAPTGEGPVPTPDLLVVHVMKTAGTSLRRMLVDGIGPEAVYPNDHDLEVLPKGWYPSPSGLVEHVAAGAHHDARLLIGHVPYVVADALPRRPLTVMLLREPVARTLSMMDHRRTRSRRFRAASYADLLADESFVRRQVRDYQTKMLAFDALEECAANVNVPLEIDDARFARAMRRLEEVDVLGVVEDLPTFSRRLERVTGIRPGRERTANPRRRARDPLEPDVRARIEELTTRDRTLYRRALELTADGGRGRGGWRGLRARWRTRR
jgi:hypothetical protein